MSEMNNFCSSAFVPLMGVIQKFLKNWLAIILPSCLLGIYQNERSTLIQQHQGYETTQRVKIDLILKLQAGRSYLF